MEFFGSRHQLFCRERLTAAILNTTSSAGLASAIYCRFKAFARPCWAQHSKIARSSLGLHMRSSIPGTFRRSSESTHNKTFEVLSTHPECFLLVPSRWILVLPVIDTCIYNFGVVGLSLSVEEKLPPLPPLFRRSKWSLTNSCMHGSVVGTFL